MIVYKDPHDEYLNNYTNHNFAINDNLYPHPNMAEKCKRHKKLDSIKERECFEKDNEYHRIHAFSILGMILDSNLL